MTTLLSSLAGVGYLVGLVCFILVVIAMFKNDQTVMGIVCIVLFFVCNIGLLVGFIIGWMKAGQWNLQKIMLIWTVAVVVCLIFGGSTGLMGGG
jgi:hypothetical protein